MPVKAFRNVKELKKAWEGIYDRLKLHPSHLPPSKLPKNLQEDIDRVSTSAKKSVFIL